MDSSSAASAPGHPGQLGVVDAAARELRTHREVSTGDALVEIVPEPLLRAVADAIREIDERDLERVDELVRVLDELAELVG